MQAAIEMRQREGEFLSQRLQTLEGMDGDMPVPGSGIPPGESHIINILWLGQGGKYNNTTWFQQAINFLQRMIGIDAVFEYLKTKNTVVTSVWLHGVS